MRKFLSTFLEYLVPVMVIGILLMIMWMLLQR